VQFKDRDKAMATTSEPISITDFTERRKQIRQKLRIKFFQHIWQFLFISGLTGGMLWVATLPDWTLRSANQVDIEGNRLLTQEALKQLVPVAYPQSIFQVQPGAIAAKLEASAPVRSVVVTRTLFPARITIQVQERDPVAKAEIDGQMGLVDADGAWMPFKSYPTKFEKPELTVLGLNKRVLPLWPSAYHQISQRRIKISQVDWRDETNLILKTELGKVHCGLYSSTEFAKQLETLERLRPLPQKLKSQSFAYIDLTNALSPILEMKSPTRLHLPETKQ
jgi:cell division protein FtsQ